MELIINDSTAESAQTATFAVRASYATNAATALYATEAGRAAYADNAAMVDYAKYANTAMWSECCENIPSGTYNYVEHANYKGWFLTGGHLPTNRWMIPTINNSISSCSYSYLDYVNYSWNSNISSANYATRVGVIGNVTSSTPPTDLIKVNSTPMTSNSSPSPLRAQASAVDSTSWQHNMSESYGHGAYNAFDHESGTYWENNLATKGYLVGIDLGAEYTVAQITVKTQGTISDYVDVMIGRCGIDYLGTVTNFLENTMGITCDEYTGGFGLRVATTEWSEKITFNVSEPVKSRYWIVVFSFNSIQAANTFGVKEIKLYLKTLSSSDATWKISMAGQTGSSFTYPSISNILYLRSKPFNIYSIGTLRTSGLKLYYYSGGITNGEPLVLSTYPRYSMSDFYYYPSSVTEITSDDIPDNVFTRGIDDGELFQEDFPKIEGKYITNEFMAKHVDGVNRLRCNKKYFLHDKDSCEIYVDNMSENSAWYVNGVVYKATDNKLIIKSTKPRKIIISAIDYTCNYTYDDIIVYAV